MLLLRSQLFQSVGFCGSLCSPSSLSSAGVKGDVSVEVSDGSVELHAGGHLSATLPRLEDQQAAVELRELLFRMADALAQHGGTCQF